MAPIEEDGAVWEFDPSSSSWSSIKPAESTKPHPPARSYHCSASDGEGAFYLHAGCPEKGRLSDLWKFDVSERSWTQLPEAPGPQRGGASLAHSKGKLYRMNGFDGSTEQGGSQQTLGLLRRSLPTATMGPRRGVYASCCRSIWQAKTNYSLCSASTIPPPKAMLELARC
jgi:hypothetical protein